METMHKMWAVWYVDSAQKLLYIEGKGSLEECVKFVEPRQEGAYAIMPYTPLTDLEDADTCENCELADTSECYFCGQDPEMI